MAVVTALWPYFSAHTSNIALSPASLQQAFILTLHGVTPASAVHAALCRIAGVRDLADARNLADKTARFLAHNDCIASAYGVFSSVDLTPAFVDAVTAPPFAGAAVRSANVVDDVNAWVCAQTHGRVSRVLEHGPSTPAVVVNVLSFKSTWQTRFDATRTQVQSFQCADGVSRPCRMMYATLRETRVVEDEFFTAACLPYADGEHCAWFVLPEIAHSMQKTCEALMTAWDDFDIDSMPVTARMCVPQLDLNTGPQSLIGALAAAGCTDLFRSGALTPMLGDTDAGRAAYIGDVAHAVALRVDEDGTEATAATAVRVVTRGMAPPVVDVVLDRPFIVVVTRTFMAHERAPLFFCVVNQP